jgi:AraC-like DNA-binding protein
MEPFGGKPIDVKKQSALVIRDFTFSEQKLQTSLEISGEDNEFNTPVFREKLTKILEEDQIFLKQGLLVTDFSRELGISSRSLPEALDKIYGKGFKDLINQHRVRYAKEKIESGYLDIFTMDSLGKEAGFNSRTTFFYAFKKDLNLSPSDFWKQFQKGPIHED